MSSKATIICVVDDDLVYQYTITRFLKAEKLAKKILVFSDGEMAMDFLVANIANVQEVPDIIFLDINMPVMDGWQFLEEYVKLKPSLGKKVTIYMVSSSVDPIDMDRAKSIEEISEYMIKPVTPDRLKEIVEQL